MTRPKPLTAGQLLDALKARGVTVTRRTLTRWVKAGAPYDKAPGRTGRLTFDLAEVVAWLAELGRTGNTGRPQVGPGAGTSLAGDRAPASAEVNAALDGLTGLELTLLTRKAALRIKELDGDKRERVEAEARGELVPRDDVVRFWATELGRVQDVSSPWPAAMTAKIVAKLKLVTGYDEILELLEDGMDRLFASLAGEVRV